MIVNRQERLFDIIGLMPLLLVVGVAIYPPFRAYDIKFIYSFIAFAFWILYSYFINPSYYLNAPVKIITIIIFNFLAIFAPYFFGNIVFGNRYLSLMPLSMLYVVFDYYKYHNKLFIIKYIIIYTIPLIAITFFKTFNGLLSNPYIARKLKTTNENTISYLKAGYGGYEFIYFMVFIAIICLYNALNNKHLYHYRIINGIGYLMLLMMIFFSNYLTATILILSSTLIMIVIYFFVNKKYLMIIFSLIVGTLFIFNYEVIIISIIDFILDFNLSGKTVVRLLDIKNSFLGESETTVADDRKATLLISFHAILNHHLLGLSATNLVYENGYISGFGQHSYIMDTFAILGIPLGLLNVFVVFIPFYDKFKDHRIVLSIPIFVMTFLLLFFNNATVSIGIAINLFFLYLYEYDKEAI